VTRSEDLVRRRWPRLWLAYLSLGLVGIAAYYPLSSPHSDHVYEGIGLTAVAAIVIGIRMHRPSHPGPWLLLAASQGCWLAGDVVWTYYPQIFHRALPYPSVADALYLLGYPFLMAALLLLLRSDRKHGRAGGWADAGVAAAVGGLLLWQYVGKSYAQTIDSLGDLANLAYPAMDVLLIGVVARLLFAPGPRAMAYRLLVASLLIVTAADAAYAILSVTGAGWLDDQLDIGWMASYALAGAAALHPSMALAAEPASDREERMTLGRLLVLVAIVAVPFVVYALRSALGLERHEGDVIVAASVIFALVIVRMIGLLRRVEAQAVELRASQDERGLLLTRMTEAAEQERRRLAAELHDGPIQRLTAVGFRADRAVMRLGAGDATAAAGLARDVADSLSGEVEGLRRIMTELRPPVLSELGLEDAIQDHLESLGARSHIDCRIDSNLGRRIGPEAETTLYRIAQESLTNVVRHARARSVLVSLAAHNGSVELRVRDDGLGFVPSKAGSPADGHFGLVAMRERVSLQGGTLTVRSAPGNGTTIVARLPIGKEAA
jgi:signal transduction histidine kinase